MAKKHERNLFTFSLWRVDAGIWVGDVRNQETHRKQRNPESAERQCQGLHWKRNIYRVFPNGFYFILKEKAKLYAKIENVMELEIWLKSRQNNHTDRGKWIRERLQIIWVSWSVETTKQNFNLQFCLYQRLILPKVGIFQVSLSERWKECGNIYKNGWKLWPMASTLDKESAGSQKRVTDSVCVCVGGGNNWQIWASQKVEN